MSEPVLTVGEVLRRTREFFTQRGIDSPRLDAELLLAEVLGCDRLALYTDHERPLSRAETDRYRELVGRRGRREPVAYILGRRAFRRLELRVTPAVLVPRPETEALVDRVLEVVPEGGSVLDWGTGSGAIALAVATERPGLTVTGVDRSLAALEVARGNDTGGVVTWIASDGFAQLVGERFDVIVANPPYLSDAELAAADPELGYEPAEALTAGPAGIETLERIVADAPAHLNPHGWLLSEVGTGQATSVAALMETGGFIDVAVGQDLAGLDRIVGGRLA